MKNPFTNIFERLRLALRAHGADLVQNEVQLIKLPGTPGGEGQLYPGSSLTNTSADFLGDWRSTNSWMMMDLWRARSRSRQLERGSVWARSFKISLCNNVLGARGFYWKANVISSRAFGDATDDVPDKGANTLIKAARLLFEQPANFTTRKNLSRRDVDRLLLARLAFDGEVIIRKIKKFDNEFGFSYQLIDPDYLDHNLNKVLENGNVIVMGVELDAQYKFPVAYHFLRSRPGGDWPVPYDGRRHIKVEASEIFHIFLPDLDTEQTRGWPWLFAAAVNLFRLGRYEEAALINATIGASKAGFFRKLIPDGFEGSPDDLEKEDDGVIVDEVAPGTWTELPWNVEPVPVDYKYPSEEFAPFEKAMLRGVAASAGQSYATLTGDISDANFSSSRVGLNEEREQYMFLQEFFIERWKVPEWDEWLYRALLARKLTLPISRFEKFNSVIFRGRRWPYINPIQDIQARALEVDNCFTSISRVIINTGEDPAEIFKEIAEDDKLMKELGISRVSKTPEPELGEQDEPPDDTGKKKRV